MHDLLFNSPDNGVSGLCHLFEKKIISTKRKLVSKTIFAVFKISN